MILDHRESLEFDVDEEDYLYDAKTTLSRISQGLFWIYKNVRTLEKKARFEAQKDDTEIAVVNGLLKDMPVDWLSCAFQWYSVSLYNYIRLVGWLVSKDPSYAIEYVNRIIPKVKTYRHKISAHFAITYPRDDNDADLISSIHTNIIYAHGYLRAGAMAEIVTDEDGNEIEPSIETSWSLTKVHNKLTPRYWPDGPLEAYQAIKMSAHSRRKFVFNWDD